jgi:hypothetical protein
MWWAYTRGGGAYIRGGLIVGGLRYCWTFSFIKILSICPAAGHIVCDIVTSLNLRSDYMTGSWLSSKLLAI